MDTLIITGQLLLSLTILVTLHECGHFFPAKWFNTKVEKFYLFFDPWFSLFKVKKGDTEYGIGWLPLGGYVKIAGMIDESFDKEHLDTEPQPWEFRSKPTWQRLIIMLGGVTVNFVLGILIFAMVAFKWGETYTPNSEIKYGIEVDSIGYELGLRDGDKIISVGDLQFDKFSPGKFKMEIIINEVNSVKVLRDGNEIEIPVDKKFTSILSSQKNKDYSLFSPRIPYIVADFPDESDAKKAGFEKEDQVIAVNNTPAMYRRVITKMVEDNSGKNINVSVLRNKRDTVIITTPVSAEGRLGILAYAEGSYFTQEVQKYGLFESFPKGIEMSTNFLGGQLKAFRKMFKGEIKAKESLGSVISIAKQFGPVWDWSRFWKMTASLSILLAFLNLLPIPGLDGGHVMFLMYEMISGRPPSDKVMEYATMAGFILLVILMIFALGLDISRLF